MPGSLFAGILIALLIASTGGGMRAEETQEAARPKSIRVVMDYNYPPFVFLDRNGTPQGILIEGWRLWEKRTGIRVDIHATRWTEALRRMRAGEYDVIDTAFETEERTQFLLFSGPYQRIDVPIFFNKAIAGISDAESLRGFAVGVKEGDADIEYLRSQGVDTFVMFPDYESLVKAARDRKVNIFVLDQLPALYFLHKFGLQDTFRQSPPLYTGEFHRAVEKRNAALLKIVEDGFALITPAEKKAINDKWFGIGEEEWFPLGRLVPVAVGVFIVLFLLGIWNSMLRRSVRRRTAELSARQHQLQQSQEKLEATLGALPDLLFEMDAEMRIVDYRAPGGHGLYAPPEVFLGRHLGEVLPPEAAAVCERSLAEAAAQGRHSGAVYSLAMPNGERWYELSVSRKGSAGGENAGFVCLVRDMTDRVQNERALRDSEQYNRTLFEQNPIGLVLCRFDGSIADANPAYARMVGRTVEEVRQMTCWDLTPEEYREHEMLLLERLRMAGRYGPREKFYLHKDGHRVPVRLNGMTLKQGGVDFIWSSVEDITEQRKTEEALRAQEFQMRHVLETAECLLWQAHVVRDTDDLRWKFFVPPSSLYRRLFGADPGPTGSFRWEELNVPEVETMRANAARAFRAGAPGYEQEFRVITGDKVTWLREQTSIAPAPDGGWDLVGVITDITARKLAEAELRDNEAKYRHLFEHNPAPMLIYERGSLHLLAVNGSFERHYGYTRAEALALRLPDIFHESERARVLDLAPRLSGHANPGEWHHVRADGTVISVVIRSHDIVYDGRVGRVAVFTDITERKQAEEALRAQEQQLDLITNSLPGPVFRVDRDLRLLFVNRGFERWFQKSQKEIAGQPVGEVVGEALAREFAPFALQALAGEMVTFESHFRNASGEEYFGQSVFVPDRAPDGAVRGFIGLVLDATERVRAEMARKAMEEQVLRAQRLESVGRLAGGIAHDLNNILSPVMLGTALLRETLPSPEANDTLLAMEISARRGADIIRQLLAFSRGASGDRGPVQLGAVVREMCAIIRETFPKNIVTRTEIPRESWTINGNATELHQVLMNLCVNAKDAMPSGGTLTITLENIDLGKKDARALPGLSAGPHVLLCVADTGMGIPEENLDRIFDPFFTTKDPGRGTGLGLSTVLGIVKGHGGIVHVSSRPEAGTRFRIYLPAVNRPAATTEIRALPLPQGRGETILLVDDETTVRTVTRRVLEKHNYRVMEAGNGREALALHVRHRADIAAVISDMVMPVMDGPTFIREIRKANCAVPVIAVSGHLHGVDLPAEERAQIQLILPKPYVAGDLLRALDTLLHPVPGADPTPNP